MSSTKPAHRPAADSLVVIGLPLSSTITASPANADNRRFQDADGAIRTDEKVVFQCGYDVVWCTQYRAPVITDQIERRLNEILTEVAEDKGARLITLNTSPAHVHGVVEISPRFGVHRLVKAMKSRSAGILRTEFPSLRSRLPSLWTNSYLVTTVGTGTPTSMIQHYVDNQKTR